MAKKNTNTDSIKGWSSVISTIFEENRRKEELLTPNKNLMRYLLDYSKVINQNYIQMELLWDLFEGGQLTQEAAQHILNNYQKENQRMINDLIGYNRFDRGNFATHNYDKVSNYRSVLKLQDFAESYYSGEPWKFQVALTLDELQQDETIIANAISKLRLADKLDYDVMNWTPAFVYEGHIVLDVTMEHYTCENEELLRKMKQFDKRVTKLWAQVDDVAVCHQFKTSDVEEYIRNKYAHITLATFVSDHHTTEHVEELCALYEFKHVEEQEDDKNE